jgi:hypothetical protein
MGDARYGTATQHTWEGLAEEVAGVYEKISGSYVRRSKSIE